HLLRQRQDVGSGAEHERKRPRVLRAQRGPRARDRLDPAAPVVWGTRLEVQLVEQTRADRREELVLAANVGIERHPLDAEEGPEAAHRDRVDALLVGELECALDDTIASEVAPLRG